MLRIGLDVSQTCTERAGCAWYADSLAHAMSNLNENTEIYLYHQFDRWINADVSGGTQIPSPHVREPFRNMTPETARRMWTDIQNGRVVPPGDPMIVHANNFRAPKVAPARLVYTIYDLCWWTHPEYTTEANRLNCQEGVLGALETADAFVFISRHSFNDFNRIFPKYLDRTAKRARVIPLASRYNLRTTKPSFPGSYWLAVGTLEPRKNYDCVLNAYELYLKKTHKRMPLWICGGSGWLSKDIQLRIQHLQKDGDIIYHGYLTDTQLLGMYRSAFCFLFPSWYEGFGLPVLEAMTQGCPVICSNTSSLPEVGGDAALYVDAAEPDALCEKMLELESSPSFWLERSELSLQQAARFSWQKTAQETLDFYHSVLDMSSGASASIGERRS